ncbi:hypothetical protein D3C73_1103350 [compost metagenome]
MQEVQRTGPQPLLALGEQCDIARQRGLQRRRRCALGELLVGLGYECVGQQRRQPVAGQQFGSVAALGPAQQLAAQRVQPTQLVGDAVDPLVVDRFAQVQEEALTVLAHGHRQFHRGVLQGRVRVVHRQRLRPRVQGGRSQQRAQVSRQRIRGGPQPGQRFQRGRVVGVHTPEIGGQFFQQFAIAGQQFRRVEGMPALQRMFAQHAGAEAVDGEDRRQVDFVGSHLQAPLQRLGTFGAVL